MAHIALISPRFEVSYWGLEHALPLLGKRASVPPACLPLLAALTPDEHQVTLWDENIQPIEFDRVAAADIVGLTGMNVQRTRMREILSELKRRGVFTVVGGPWVSVDENHFGDLADVVFVGEAEETWPRFLHEWRDGRPGRRYEQARRTDMKEVPVPRYDLLPMRHYLFGSVQFSRGCPFQCEFCDIIVTFGRRPRLKNAAQVVAELEALRAHNMHIAFIVDDNLVGNKGAVKDLLREVTVWQQAHGYPLTFFAEASLDLAGDDELLQCMAEANIQTVFVGIESTNEESLQETRKLQNIDHGRTLLERVHAIQNAGIEVWCGMIVGFDHDEPTIFAAQREFVQRAHINHAMISMLSAIPKTPLYQRLSSNGRLDPEDSSFGTNVIPLAMSRRELRDGFVQLMQDLYEPNAYFERFEALYLVRHFTFGRSRAQYWLRHPWIRFKAQAADLARSAFLCWRLIRHIPQPQLRRVYRRRLWHLLRTRPDPSVLFIFSLKCAVHYHHYLMAERMAYGKTPPLNPF
ncbi:MAG: B12-binding domain-containing radical SAM protein [Pirellulaceae bacterium]